MQEPLPGSNTDRLASAVVEISQNAEDVSIYFFPPIQLLAMVTFMKIGEF